MHHGDHRLLVAEHPSEVAGHRPVRPFSPAASLATEGAFDKAGIGHRGKARLARCGRQGAMPRGEFTTLQRRSVRQHHRGDGGLEQRLHRVRDPGRRRHLIVETWRRTSFEGLADAIAAGSVGSFGLTRLLLFMRTGRDPCIVERVAGHRQIGRIEHRDLDATILDSRAP